MILNTIGAPLIKIQSPDIIESLKSGNVYMNSLSYFRNLEEINCEIGDSYEGRLHVNQGMLAIPELEINTELKDGLLRTAVDDAFVFCLFSVQDNQKSFSFTNYQKRELLGFGDTSLIILDRDEFIRRLVNRLYAAGYTVSFGYVKYFNPAEDSVTTIVGLVKFGIESVALNKREKYSYQQEFRIIAQKANPNGDHICVNIGTISDISQQVTTEKLLKSTFLGS